MNKQVRVYFWVTAVVVIALSSARTAVAQNTKFGTGALASDTTGTDDTALGYYALFSNKTGSYNTATGLYALFHNTAASYNTATGVSALRFNTTGAGNTATGVATLYSNSSGANNTASGFEALYKNTTGAGNTATGVNALYDNTSGGDNTATGEEALFNNTTGFLNTADGDSVLYSNTTGIINTAAGSGALYSNTTGGNNIGLGVAAGSNLTTGNSNIDICDGGVAGESNTIRIGYPNNQSATYIAGVSDAAVTGSDVVVDANGKLGVMMSSARYKRDIQNMGEASSSVLKLRPVTFRYKDDRSGARQYGLVAEEVERVYPELVSYGRDGKVETVSYLMLTSMLLNELQKEARRVEDQTWALQNQARALQEQTLEHRRLAHQLTKFSAQSLTLKTSTGREVAELKASYARELRSMQERLAAMEQAMQTLNSEGKLAAGEPLNR